MDTLQNIANLVRNAPREKRRRLVAIAGPPATGKTTLAWKLAGVLTQSAVKTQVVPMDGFHLHNDILDQRDLRRRKGAPETFDVVGLVALLSRLAEAEDVYYPIFDRNLDLSLAGRGYLKPDCDTVLIEGNYLLLDQPIWRDMQNHWDFSLYVDTPIAELETRLLARWAHHGIPPAEAQERAAANDIPNARLVRAQSDLSQAHIVKW